jgi:hypothetical protein
MILTDGQIRTIARSTIEDKSGEQATPEDIADALLKAVVRSAKVQLKAVAEWLIKNKSKADAVDYVTIIIDKKEWAELLKEAL